MTLYTEIDWSVELGGQIESVHPAGVAAELGLQAGDELLAINGHKVADVIDVHYYGAEENLELLIRRSDELRIHEGQRDYGQQLGLDFRHPTFDTDIRRCNNLCEFCFVLQMAPRFRRTLYIKDDDYRYSFLFGHFVTLTNLNEHDWWRIETMRLSPLYVSVHTTDLELRRQFLRNPDAPDVMGQLRWLAERNIDLHTQLVIVPGFNDGHHLQRSIQDLSSLWPAVKSVSVVPVGLTKQHKYSLRTHTIEEANEMLDFLEPVSRGFLRKQGERFVYASDEWFLLTGREIPSEDYYDQLSLHENGLGMVRRFLNEWRAVRQEIADHKANSVDEKRGLSSLAKEGLTLVTGKMFAPVLSQIALEFQELAKIDTRVLAVENKRLGSTITAAGLLMAEDVLYQLGQMELGGVVILPRVMFDHPHTLSLDDHSPQDIANALDVQIVLGDFMGDVWDACLGKAKTVYRPS